VCFLIATLALDRAEFHACNHPHSEFQPSRKRFGQSRERVVIGERKNGQARRLRRRHNVAWSTRTVRRR
jgi:hypothetical protein